MSTLYELGYLSVEDLKKEGVFPDEKRFAQGPVAIIECIQEIPCNPCEDSCPFHAIFIGEDISKNPILDLEKCTGCGTCVSVCPGLAIFLENKSYSDTLGYVELPFEYLPIPNVGDVVRALDRSGRVMCEGKVLRVTKTRRNDRTVVLRLEIPIEFVDEIRSLSLIGESNENGK